MIVVCLQPAFGTGDDLKKGFSLRVAFQFCLTLALLNPEDGIVGVAVNDFVMETLVPAQGEGMYDGEKLPDVVRTMHGTIVEDTIARLKIDGLILHGSGIAAAGGIHGPCVCLYLHRQRQYSIMAIIWRVLSHILHTFRDFNAQEGHRTLDDLGDVFGEHEAEKTLLLIRLVENRVVVIELIKYLREFVAVVGNARGGLVFACLLNGSSELVHLLNQFYLLFV